MKPSSTDTSILTSFAPGFVCQDPLDSPLKLSSGKFPIPVSFIYGELDWVRVIEEDGPKNVVEANPNKGSKIHVIKNSDHNIQMENPDDLSQAII
jgi:pimeloyl-ACP methyl ester carboxylesterase